MPGSLHCSILRQAVTIMAKRKISGVLLDITGVLYESSKDGGMAIQGSAEAVQKLRDAGFKLKFCTNETVVTKKSLVEKLRGLGFSLSEGEVHSPAPACITYLRENNLRPLLLVHPDALEDYKEVETGEPNCVVLADATGSYMYNSLNSAFQLLIRLKPNPSSSPLIALGKGRYYREGEELTLDVGPFMAALEYATGLSAVVIGKPSSSFFMSALQDLQVEPEEAVMVGDDVLNDVGGAQRCGLMGILVRTGKYRTEDEERDDVKPDQVVGNLAAAVNYILGTCTLQD